MALFNRGYDRDYNNPYRNPYRSSDSPGDSGWRGDRSFWSRSGRPMRPNYESDFGFQQRDRFSGGGWRESPRFERGYYGEDFSQGRGYGREYKSRWQTDYGDPFNDRGQRTPMRVIRGEPRQYDLGLREPRYGREYNYDTSGYPMRDRPGADRTRYDAGYNRRTFRTYERGYDNDWF